MSAPRIEFAPGLFSTTIVHPFCSATFCTTMRVAPSVMPPGGYGTIQRIDLVGHAGPCAWRTVEASSASATSASLCSMMKPPGCGVRNDAVTKFACAAGTLVRSDLTRVASFNDGVRPATDIGRSRERTFQPMEAAVEVTASSRATPTLAEPDANLQRS